ncbi:hypothetical protein OHA21_00985 [Actinoplanes sp. NBC_00393]|uniref:hypothetical protein n=1 Tax=Actinoplanes sp. NBC_00393 TaxID=2975953 RepID=UPI002E206008
MAVKVSVTEFEEISSARVFAARQADRLRTPMVQESQLPLRELTPEVFERLVAEFALQVEGLRNAHFYGRRGQKQYGLDVVGTTRDGRTVVYQAKRFQSITIEDVREAVEAYAGKPDSRMDPSTRRFGASQFVLATSAPIEEDTGFTDDLLSLCAKYDERGLAVDVYGAEHLSRSLRDASGLVYAIFGPDWSRAFCGVEPPPPTPGRPSAYGLLEGPLEELGLAEVPSRARTIAQQDPENGAQLLASIAGELRAHGYRGHADTFIREAAQTLLDAGLAALASDILWDVAMSRFFLGADSPPDVRSLSAHLPDDPVRAARWAALDEVSAWYGWTSSPAAIFPALDILRDADDSEYAVLACIAMEQALTDGLFTGAFSAPPPTSTATADPNDSSTTANRLLDHGQHAATICRDRVWRCRLRCAVADASLDRLERAPSTRDVASHYDSIVIDAGAGRIPPAAAALAFARCARAYATAGDVETSVDHWRRSFMESVRAEYGGDARSAITSLEQTASLAGLPDLTALSNVLAGIPDRRSFLGGSYDSYLSALEDLHSSRLRAAIRQARRSLLQERAGGYISGERLTRRILSDVLEKAARPSEAVVQAVLAGDHKLAVRQADGTQEWIDLVPIAHAGPPWVAAAAIRVLAAQQELVPDDRIAEIVDLMLVPAEVAWQTWHLLAVPPVAAFNALASFAFRVDVARAERLVALAEPGMSQESVYTKQAALIVARIAVRFPEYVDRAVELFRSAITAYTIGDDLWSVIRQLPDLLAPLTDDIRASAARGNHHAVRTLSEWGIATTETRRTARENAYRLLRTPIGRVSNSVGLSVFRENTAQLVRALVRSGNDDDGPLNLQLPPGDEADDRLPNDDHAAIGVLVAGDVTDLAAAVVDKLLDLAGDHLASGQSRAEAVRAVVAMRDVVPPARALEIAEAFLRLSREVGLHPLDALAFTTDPLASVRMTNPPETLQAAAADAASRLYTRAKAADPALGDDQTAAQIVEAAEPFLRSDNDRECVAAAWAIGELASSDASLASLAWHRLADVRVLAMNVWDRNINHPLALVRQLAADPSPKVRASVARRHAALAAAAEGQAILAELAVDPHHGVRAVLARNQLAPEDSPDCVSAF